MGIKIQAIRDSARGEQCTLKTFKCTDDTETTVFCHGPRVGWAGMGQKTDDWWGAYGCAACHSVMDQHEMPTDMHAMFWLKAISRTQRRLYEKGIMQFPEKTRKQRTVNKVLPRRPMTRSA